MCGPGVFDRVIWSSSAIKPNSNWMLMALKKNIMRAKKITGEKMFWRVSNKKQRVEGEEG